MRLLRSLRRRILTPNVRETRMDVRGFTVKNDASKRLLETVGSAFLTGYGYAAEAPGAAAAEPRLETIPTQFRGFAYEGAAMALAMRDGLRVGRPRHVAELLAGRGDAHAYMAYVGVGWAMARLPRFRWHRLHAPDPLLRWLVLDGYGFHQAYFRTARYAYLAYRPAAFPWPGDDRTGYAVRAIDQGVGRALWFVGGTDVDRVGELIGRFAPERRADLYAGAGLAATYAGGASEAELVRFRQAAGEHRDQLAQGSAFAAGARVRAGLVVPHNEVATAVFCGTTPAEAAKVTDAALAQARPTATRPAYESWRLAIAEEFRHRC
ncbi:DUF1702 family protein [Micromonospora chaiyaphumensis]|uniref:Enediyne biosynthesis protein n=1 Tax=Micromonospora chaiyaphumensis TaxID=307119 RepID=A0A1C4W0Z2_9ACTN|nr:DUF1702 family protein [Micromonospora chaiyaphumensis]SCE89838.1 Protein of unknown function [Micromonospora chaiyaphumensis]